MTCPTLASFAYEIMPTEPQVQPTPGRPRLEHSIPTPVIAANPLERLAQLMNSNERLMDELATSRLRVSDARAYLDVPGCNLRFGEAHLDRCRTRHSGILSQLRANRIEALRLLGEGGSGV
jgi:hypothetical protein